MKRRAFIGGGMAAILAARHAPAFCIAMRNGMIRPSAPPTPPWSNPYVTDGLVAMWDGEWNAGGGVHDASATTWKDLIGGYDLDINGVVLDDSVSNVGKNRAAAFKTSLVIEGINTIEVCHDFGGDLVPYGIMFCSGATKTSSRRLTLVHYGSGATGFQSYPDVFWGYSGINAAHKTTISATSNSCYVGGSALSLTTHSTDEWNNGDVVGIGGRGGSGYQCGAKYYCVRCYSRALTAAEVAANYAVDAQRFGIGGNS